MSDEQILMDSKCRRSPEDVPQSVWDGYVLDLRDARTRIAELESTEESMRCDIIDLSQKLSEANAKLAALRDSAPPPRGQGQGGKPCKQKSDNPAGKYINESV